MCVVYSSTGLWLASAAPAQDPFEIHIYEYEPLSWRQYSLEAHRIWYRRGTAERTGAAATARQTHLTNRADLLAFRTIVQRSGFMFLNAWQPGYYSAIAGWRSCRISTRPEYWRLPVAPGIGGRFSFQKTRYRGEFAPRGSCVRFWTASSRNGSVFQSRSERGTRGPWHEARLNFAPALLSVETQPFSRHWNITEKSRA